MTYEEKAKEKFHYITIHKHGEDEWNFTAEKVKDTEKYIWVTAETTEEGFKKLLEHE